MNLLLTSPVWSLLLTMVVFLGSHRLYRKYRNILLSPPLVTIAALVLFLQTFAIPYQYYHLGAQTITAFMPLTVVCLAMALFHHRQLIRRHWLAVLLASFFSALAHFATVLALAHLCGLATPLRLALFAKSVTTPIAVEIAEEIGANPALTILSVMLTGIVAIMVQPLLAKLLTMNLRAARGAALGTAAHALGTGRAFELGEEEGAFATICMIVTAIVTSFLAPYLLRLFALA